MTVEERFERLEHYTAGLNDMFQRQREEDRAHWREVKKELEALSRETDERFRETDRRFKEVADQMAATDKRIEKLTQETNQQIRELGTRIESLVSGMGEFVRIVIERRQP